jgi:hypothetical protein
MAAKPVQAPRFGLRFGFEKAFQLGDIHFL